MFAIQIQGNVFIKEFVPAFRNVRVSRDFKDALKFADKKEADVFFKEHDGQDHGFSRRGSILVDVIGNKYRP
jgi:hypothetical protein